MQVLTWILPHGLYKAMEVVALYLRHQREQARVSGKGVHRGIMQIQYGTQVMFPKEEGEGEGGVGVEAGGEGEVTNLCINLCRLMLGYRVASHRRLNKDRVVLVSCLWMLDSPVHCLVAKTGRVCPPGEGEGEDGAGAGAGDGDGVGQWVSLSQGRTLQSIQISILMLPKRQHRMPGRSVARKHRRW